MKGVRRVVNRREWVALALAALQTADMVVTLVSPRYGTEHLDHLGVPRPLQPALPVIKATAVAALVVTARRPALRSLTGATLVAYYSAAATFHVGAGDSAVDTAPAVACGVLAGLTV